MFNEIKLLIYLKKKGYLDIKTIIFIILLLFVFYIIQAYLRPYT